MTPVVTCPWCGARIDQGAARCPECGGDPQRAVAEVRAELAEAQRASREIPRLNQPDAARMTGGQRVRVGLAALGAVLALLAALAGGFFMALGNASDSGGNDPPPMPFPQVLYFPALLIAAGLAIAAALLIGRSPRRGAFFGFSAVLVGGLATVICVYDKVGVLIFWITLTSPISLAALMGLAGKSAPLKTRSSGQQQGE